MTIALGTVGLLLCLNALGLVLSIPLDRYGLPKALNAQTSRRKKNTLPRRLPLIGLNLSLLVTGAFFPLWWLADLFTMDFPALPVLTVQVLLLIFLDDLWFYWIHRAIHVNKKLYRTIHKKHHEAYAPVPIEYLYVHPVEWMAGGVGPAIGLGLILLTQGEMSAWTLWIWGGWRLIHELDIHSGTTSLVARFVPLFAGTEHHDRHHARPTLGNYASSLTLWDKVFHTEINAASIKR